MPRRANRPLMVNENPMVRTTISLHESILKRVKDLSDREHTTLGKTLSELLCLGLMKKEERLSQPASAFRIREFSMGKPLVPLEDKAVIAEKAEKGLL